MIFLFPRWDMLVSWRVPVPGIPMGWKPPATRWSACTTWSSRCTSGRGAVFVHVPILHLFWWYDCIFCVYTCIHVYSIHILYIYNKHPGPRHVYVFINSLAFIIHLHLRFIPPCLCTMFQASSVSVLGIVGRFRRCWKRNGHCYILVGKWWIFVGPPICFCEAIPLIAGWR